MDEPTISFQMASDEETTFTAQELQHTNLSDDETNVTVISWNQVVEMEHELDDPYVTIGYKDDDNDTVYLNMCCTNEAEAEHMMDEALKRLTPEYSDSVAKMSKWDAASGQIFLSAGAAIIGGVFSAVMYSFYMYVPTRDRIVKWWFALLYRLAKAVGYMPFLILTILASVGFFLWALKRMANPLQHRVISRSDT